MPKQKPLLFLILFTLLIQAYQVDPYLVLQLQTSATQLQVREQYYNLISKLKNTKKNQIRKKMYEEAYREIMLVYILNGELEEIDLMGNKGNGEGNGNGKSGVNGKEKISDGDASGLGGQTQDNAGSSVNESRIQSNGSSLQSAKFIYSLLGILIKIVPFVVIIWLCIRNSQNFKGTQSQRIFRSGRRKR